MSNESSGIGRRDRIRLILAHVMALSVVMAGPVVAAESAAPPAQPRVTQSSVAAFVDVPPGAAFYTEIMWLASEGVATGWIEPDGSRTFRPLLPVTRDAMAAFLYRLAGEPAFSPPDVSPFTDVAATTVFYREITWLYHKDITTGWVLPDGSRVFRPSEAVERAAMAAFLYRFEGRPSFTSPVVSPFFDVIRGEQFYLEMTWLLANGISTGWPEPSGCPTYRPHNGIERGAMAAFLYRLVNGGVEVPSNTCGRDWTGVDWEVLPTTWNVAALTFDGGASNAGVSSILDTLDSYDVPATFFVTGQFARAYPSSVRAMAAGGHPVGNHSDTHPYFASLTNEQIGLELARADASISPLISRSTKPLFRFPYGDRTSLDISVVNGFGYVPFRWTVDTLGWRGTSEGVTAEIVCQRAVGAARPGEIVLMHVGANPNDGTTLDADALPCIIDGLRAKGYNFVHLREFVR